MPSNRLKLGIQGHFAGTPDRIRTCDLLLRRQAILYEISVILAQKCRLVLFTYQHLASNLFKTHLFCPLKACFERLRLGLHVRSAIELFGRRDRLVAEKLLHTLQGDAVIVEPVVTARGAKVVQV